MNSYELCKKIGELSHETVQLGKNGKKRRMLLSYAAAALSLVVLTALFANIINYNRSLTNDPADHTDNYVNAETKKDDGENLPGAFQIGEMLFTEAVEKSDCAAIGKLLSSEEQPEGIEYTFEIKEVLRGNIPESIIHIFASNKMYSSSGDTFSKGEEYVLVMTQRNSLFYSGTGCGFYSDLFLPVADISDSTMYGMQPDDIKKMSIDDIKAIIRNAGMPADDQGERYTTASDLPTIVSETDFVLKVTITELFVDSDFANSNTYNCEVSEVLKGDSLAKAEGSGTVMLTLLKGSVDVGKTYVVLVNQVGEQSIIYTQSSLKSVVPIDDTATISEIERLISEK